MKRDINKAYVIWWAIILAVIVIGVICFHDGAHRKVMNCNVHVLLGLDDYCAGYYGNTMECAHAGSWRSCYSGGFYFPYFNPDLTTEQSIELCYKLIHPAMAADCLRQNSDDKQVCLDFANGDPYLTAICNLGTYGKLDESQFRPRAYNQF
ncbi:MAG: hypothetical protein NTZ83_03120 [Candidatus Pacearchaeota archaeon]|nr:hypothetical protein [Candidatus Pacearchaeota archaeon]